MPAADTQDVLAQNPFLSVLPGAAQEAVREAAATVSCRLGETVVQAGEPADGFYVVFSGRARVVAPSEEEGERPVTLATLQAGESFGEQSLLHDRPAGATVRAAGALVLLKVPADVFQRLAREHPAFRERLEAHIARYKEYNFLRRLDVLAALSQEEVRELAATVETVALADGEFLFHEGDAGDAVYVISEGRLRVIKESAGRTLLAVVRPGSLIGEMSLLYQRPRSAGIVADGPAQVLRLAKADFQRVLSSDKAQELLVKQSTHRLLQQRSLLAEDDEGERDASAIGETRREEPSAPRLHESRERVGSGFWSRLWSRRWPVVQVEDVASSGVACLAAIDRFYHQDYNRRPLLEAQIESGEPDDLRSLSEKAERTDYLTRLVSLAPEQLTEASYPAVAETVDGTLRLVWSASEERVVYMDPLRDSETHTGERAGEARSQDEDFDEDLVQDGREGDSSSSAPSSSAPPAGEGGLRSVSRESFAETWSGRLLTFSYVPNFADVDWDGKAGRLLRRIAPMVKPYLHLLGWILAITLLTQLLSLAVPLFTQVIIDRVLVGNDYALLYLLLAGMLVVTGFKVASSALNSLLRTYLLRQVGVSVVLRFFDHVLSLPNKISERWEAADFLSRFEENEKLLQLAAQTGFKIVVSSITALSYLVVLLMQSATLTGLALVFVAAYAGLMIWASPRLRANDRRVFESRKEVESYLIETVTGIETVKGLARAERFFERGRRRFADALDAEYRGAHLGFNVQLLGGMLNQASTVAVLGYGATLVLNGQMSAGELVAFNGVLGLLLAPLQSLIKGWDEVEEMRVSFERISDVLALPTEPRVAEASLPEPLRGRVRFENVRFCYDEGGPDVIDDVTLDVQPGQKIALVGRSGSGKTTFVKLLTKLLEPTAGRILIDGIDVARLRGAALRRRLGIIEQDPYLFSGTIAENIAQADPDASLDRIVAAATLAGAHPFVEELPLGYRTPIGERGTSLSGGQRQRLVIARALLGNPAMLVMDEATAALDTETERLIQDNIDEMMDGRTVFTIAHRLSTVRNADQIVVLDEGRIAETGTHDELMQQRGLYHYFHEKAGEEPVAAA